MADGQLKVALQATPTIDIGDVTLLASTANIGDVDVLTVPADPFGANADAASATGSISAKLRSLATAAAPPATGTQTSVASSATDVTILAANTNRKGALVFNDSTQVLYLLLASGTSSATAYSVQLAANTLYELPLFQGGVYTGILKGIWASANGNARVTELT